MSLIENLHSLIFIQNSENISEYMQIIEKYFSIPEKFIHQYVEIYMNALNEKKRYTEKEYREFMRIVYEIIGCINDGNKHTLFHTHLMNHPYHADNLTSASPYMNYNPHPDIHESHSIWE